MNYFKLFATLVKAMIKSLSTRQYVLTFEKESDNLWYIKMPWAGHHHNLQMVAGCLLYTSPSPRDGLLSRMPSSA